MLRWFYAFVHLLIEAQAARRDARIRLLMAQVEILRRKLGGKIASWTISRTSPTSMCAFTTCIGHTKDSET